MLDVVSGPFHPGLETEFVRRLREAKRDPLAPVVVVAPSRRLAARLKELALETFPGGVAGLHVHNLYSFARELYGDAPGVRLVEDDLFHEKLVLDIIRREFPSSVYLSRARQSRGSGRAILGALKDLRDGLVDPADAIRFFDEGGLGDPADRKLAELLALYRSYAGELQKRRLHGRPDVAIVAARNTARIAGARVFYYGFYELVQTQIDLFRAVVRDCDVTLFYPYVEDDPDFAFARDFFDSQVRGAAASRKELPRRKAREPVVVAASGARDEVWACAKWILGKRDDGIPFHEIGVVARSLDGYVEAVESVFREHSIPFTSSASRPVERDPKLVAAKALIDLEAGGFRRDEVMDLLLSPFFHRDPEADPRKWDLATRLMGIGRGRAEWEARISPWTGKDYAYTEGGRGNERAFTMEAAQVALLREALRALMDAATAPAEAGWAERAAWARSLCGCFLGPHEPLDETFDALAALAEVLPAPTATEFRETFRARLARLDRPAGTDNAAGVRVLDAMAARGLPFRALTVLGMNERTFPRFILEDPFVTDAVRERLNHRLGNRLPVKLRGYEEERLLFALLRDAAGDELVLSYQRSDERGRVQVPSIFLENRQPDRSIPRRPADKLAAEALARLTPREALIHAELKGGSGLAAAKGLAGVTKRPAAALDSSLAFQKKVDRAGDADIRDGLTGPLKPWWEKASRRGLSPTSLETFAACPFRFYSEKILSLETLEAPEDEEETSPLETGLLYHRVLEKHLRGMSFDEALAEGFAWFESTRTIRYPVLWTSERLRVRAVLEAFLEADRGLRGTFTPAAFEQRVEGELVGVRFAGYVDRLDVDGNSFQVVDYKRSRSAKFRVSMETGIFKHGTLVQPPLYFLLAAEYLRSKGLEPDLAASRSGYLFLEGIEKEKDRAAWLDGSFAERKDEWLALLKRSVDAIAGGRFVLKENPGCKHCDFRTMCRKSHLPTRMRSRRHHEEARA